MGFGVEEMERKARPSLRRDSGMNFPFEQASGKHVPFWARIPGWIFRLGRHWESASYSALLRRFLYARALHRVRFSAGLGFR